MVVAPVELAEAVDGVEVAGVQLGEVDVREVGIQAVRADLRLPMLRKEREREGGRR